MTQKATLTVELKEHTVNKAKRMAQLSSIIGDSVVSRTRKTTQNCVQKAPKTYPKLKEEKKHNSPLREIMKNRNLQHELKKSKRDRIKLEPILDDQFDVDGKENLKKTDKVCKEKNLQDNRNGILKNRRQCKTPETKTNKSGRIQGSSKTVDVVKKSVRFTDQYDCNGRLKKNPRNYSADGGVAKFSKFLEETHNNIKTLTDQVSQEAGPGNEHLKETTNKNAKIESTGQLKLTTDLNLKQSLGAKPSLSLMNFIDGRTIADDGMTFNKMDTPRFISEESSIGENRQSSENTDQDSDDNGYEESDCSFECENFIRTNFSFPVLAVGFISAVCVLLLRDYNV